MTARLPHLTEVEEAIAHHARSLAERLDVPASDIRFGVITRIAEPPSANNMAAALNLFLVLESRNEANGYVERVERVAPSIAVNLRAPVFILGEVLILGSSGRELVGLGRMPGKWDVDCEEFDDVTSAIIRSWQVTGRL